MNYLKITIISVLLALLVLPLMAQVQTSGKRSARLNYRAFALPGPRLEAGISMGAANAITDIASRNPDEPSSLLDVYSRGLSPSLALFGRYKFNSAFALKGSASALMLRGNDRWSPEIEIVNRGKSFTNNVIEASVVGELYMPRSYKRLKQDFRLNWMDLYLFSGLSVFYHNPQLKGPVIDDFDYLIMNTDNVFNQIQLGVPIGAGMKWTLASQWTLGMDFNFRYTFFDYLDGFRRPSVSRNDHFFSGSLSIGYILRSSQQPSNRTVNSFVFDRSNNNKTRNARSR